MENEMKSGDWQIPTEQAPKKHKLLFIIIIALAIFVAIGAFIVAQRKDEEGVAGVRGRAKVYTAEEKAQILQTISTARVQQAGSLGSPVAADGTAKPVAQVEKERTQILQTLSTTVPKKTTLSDEEKLKILNSLNR